MAVRGKCAPQFGAPSRISGALARQVDMACGRGIHATDPGKLGDHGVVSILDASADQKHVKVEVLQCEIVQRRVLGLVE